MFARVMPGRSGFFADYALGEELGKGCFGTVFEATAVRREEGHHSSSEDGGDVGEGELRLAPRCVAVKRIDKKGMDDWAKQDVKNEVRESTKMNSTNPKKPADIMVVAREKGW